MAMAKLVLASAAVEYLKLLVHNQSGHQSRTSHNGLEFRTDSTSVKTDIRTSSSTRLSPTMDFIAVRILCIKSFQTPPACEGFGG